MSHPSTPLLWDIFCQVIDNHGDLGVCWRLTRQLAEHGHQVRLWVDDARALPWLAPGALEGQWPGVQVLDWHLATLAGTLQALPRGDVWIEAFGCEIPAEFVRHFFVTAKGVGPNNAPPVWINLEYLSAESYVERMHALPSPILHGPAAGHCKWFFYPGFTAKTGGLLRETHLLNHQTRFDRAAWLAQQGIDWQGERLVSLFCYEPAPLHGWLHELTAAEQPTHLLVTPGRPAAAVRAALSCPTETHSAERYTTERHTAGKLTVTYLPYLPQPSFDELLWACDLNFVRGEDSLVRALWAGQPFVWHIYPQEDDAHHAKLDAFLQWIDAPESLRQFHRLWNGIQLPPRDQPGLNHLIRLADWRACAQAAREQLTAQDDLITQIVGFVAEKR